jgi:hypothetical protein
MNFQYKSETRAWARGVRRDHYLLGIQVALLKLKELLTNIAPLAWALNSKFPLLHTNKNISDINWFHFLEYHKLHIICSQMQHSPHSIPIRNNSCRLRFILAHAGFYTKIHFDSEQHRIITWKNIQLNCKNLLLQLSAKRRRSPQQRFIEIKTKCFPFLLAIFRSLSNQRDTSR